MPLELATRLILRDSHDGSPLDASRLKPIVARWSGADRADSDALDEAPGRNGGQVSTSSTSLASGQERWDLAYVRTDDEDETVRWRAEVTALFDVDRTTFVTRLRRDSVDHRLRPLRGAPRPPRVIADVLRADGIDCFDGPLRVQPRFLELEEAAVDGFLSTQLVTEDRRLPVLAVAKSRGQVGRLDLAELRKVLAGFAHVVLVDRAALPRLGEQLESLSLPQDSARIWWPSLVLDDDASVHPCWHGPYADPAAHVEAIRRLVLGVSRDRWREPSRLLEFSRRLRRQQEETSRAAAARLSDDLARLRREASEARERAQASTARSATEAVEAAPERLAAMAEDMDALNRELEQAQIAVHDAEALYEETDVQRSRLEQENRALQGQLEGLRAQLKERAAAAGADALSPEADFRNEVLSAYETRLTPDDRERYELVEFAIRDGFVDSIAEATADYGKVVNAVMEVACGLAREMDGRQLHNLRTSDSGNAPERRRESDGAVAWRCYIQRNSPAARRLHYWACPGGKIEFACVVTHDDFSIPE